MTFTSACGSTPRRGEPATPTPTPTPSIPPWTGTYDVVFVRYPRHGEEQRVRLPEGEIPYVIEPGGDLMLLRPDGTTEMLVDCPNEGATNCSVQDPSVSFDGTTVYYAKYVDIDTEQPWHFQPAHSFIFKMALKTPELEDIPASERREVQITDFGSGFATDKLNGSGDEDRLKEFGIRDLGPTPLPGGRIVFTSNREAVVAIVQGVRPDLDALGASTASQLFVVDDHDGTIPNRNLRLIGHSQLHMVQHPLVLADGRIVFSNWDDAAIRVSYGVLTLYSCDQDGGNLHQFLEPHNYHKRVDHFLAQLSSGHVITVDYYPGASWGFGVLHSYDVDVGDPEFQTEGQHEADDYRFFSRRGLVNLTPHTSGEDELVPDASGRYSVPAAGPDGRLWVAYSPGQVAVGPPATNGEPGRPLLDSGLYFFDGAPASLIDTPSKLTKVLNDEAYNEMWPRPLVPYHAIHGRREPAKEPPPGVYAPSQPPMVPPGSPFAFIGTSSMLNRQSTYVGDLLGFNDGISFREGGPPFGVQGTDAGVITDDEVFGVRVIIVTPDRYRSPSSMPYDEATDTRFAGDERYTRVVKGYYSHSEENWKILGELPVRNRGGTPDPGSTGPDTSFLARVPANTPLFLQGIDRNGLTLFTEQTWRHLTPGQTQADCGGCHAHSIPGVPMTGKLADSRGYDPVDLVTRTPVLRDGDVVERPQAGLWGPEFARDVYPVLARECRECHSGETPTDVRPDSAARRPQLSMFSTAQGDDAASHGAIARAYASLAFDKRSRWAVGAPGPSDGDSFRFPQVSRYVRAIQARESLLAWKVYGRRLDGRTDATREDDVDFGTFSGDDACPAAERLTVDEKGLLTRWIDLGCTIDLDPASNPRETYTGDHLLPVLAVHPFVERDDVKVRVGALDVESGIDTSRDDAIVVEAEVPPPEVATVRRTLRDLDFDRAAGLATASLGIKPSRFSPAAPLKLRVTVRDRAGNLEREELYVGAVE
jgi:hypothetical protein